MHYVNKTKDYFNLKSTTLKWLKDEIGFKLFISEHCNECYNYK
jgi:hypothetical protein